jgi:hypothetical protein
MPSEETDRILETDALEVVERAQKKGITLRIMGALAIKLHSASLVNVQKRLQRLGQGTGMFTDIDLIGYSKQMKGVADLLEKEMGYVFDVYLGLHATKRHKYLHPKNHYSIDVFYDQLSFSHSLFFGDKPGKGRLELDYPTISPTDLFLEKCQIHQLTEKDTKDLTILLLSHDVSNDDAAEKINGKYVATLLSDNWGFSYDVDQNMKKVREFAVKSFESSLLNSNESSVVCSKIDCLLKMIGDEPKTRSWLQRAKIGTAKPWFMEVEEAPTT